MNYELCPSADGTNYVRQLAERKISYGLRVTNDGVEVIYYFDSENGVLLF